jgi:hypothetical protein
MRNKATCLRLFMTVLGVSLVSSGQTSRSEIERDVKNQVVRSLIVEEANRLRISLPLSSVKKSRAEIIRDAEEHTDRVIRTRMAGFDEYSHRAAIAATVPLLRRNDHLRFQRTDGLSESGTFYYFDGNSVNISGRFIGRRLIPAQVLARLSEEIHEQYISAELDKLRSAAERENLDLRNSVLGPELDKRFEQNGFYKIGARWMDHSEVRSHLMSVILDNDGEFKNDKDYITYHKRVLAELKKTDPDQAYRQELLNKYAAISEGFTNARVEYINLVDEQRRVGIQIKNARVQQNNLPRGYKVYPQVRLEIVNFPKPRDVVSNVRHVYQAIVRDDERRLRFPVALVYTTESAFPSAGQFEVYLRRHSDAEVAFGDTFTRDTPVFVEVPTNVAHHMINQNRNTLHSEGQRLNQIDATIPQALEKIKDLERNLSVYEAILSLPRQRRDAPIERNRNTSTETLTDIFGNPTDVPKPRPTGQTDIFGLPIP